MLLGCGGESGGSSTGIGGALTNASPRISSFTLTTVSSINELTPLSPATPPISGSVESVDGSLYPTRNSLSFRVVIKGARSDREDAEYYFDIYKPDQDGQYSGHTPSEAEPWDKTKVASGGVPQTELRHIYFAQPLVTANGKPTVPYTIDTVAKEVKSVVFRPASKDGKTPPAYVYEESGIEVPKANGVPPLYTIQDNQNRDVAFSYTQVTNLKPIRVGRRNVIVQFFSDTATNVQQHYVDQKNAPDPDAAPYNETEFLKNKLTNSYVFTADVAAKTKAIPLTGGFQTNNGDNGLVDSGDLTLVARSLPRRWGSVKFEAYEEQIGFGKPGIVFSKIVNLTDSPNFVAAVRNTYDSLSVDNSFPTLPTGPLTFAQLVEALGRIATVKPDFVAPSYISASGYWNYVGASGNWTEKDDPNDLNTNHRGGFTFANRQRILKVYATCYELPDATGAVLAQTLDDGTRFNQPGYPVVFIPQPQATVGGTYPDDSTVGLPTSPSGVTNGEKRLQNLTLVSAISGVTASAPEVAQGARETIVVRASTTSAGRSPFNVSPPASQTQTRTLSNVGIYFSIANLADGSTTPPTPNQGPYTVSGASVYHLPNVLATPAPPTDTGVPGQVFWRTDALLSPAKFSQLGFRVDPSDSSKDVKFESNSPATVVRFQSYAGSIDFPVYLTPNQGTGGGVIRGVGR